MISKPTVSAKNGKKSGQERAAIQATLADTHHLICGDCHEHMRSMADDSGLVIVPGIPAPPTRDKINKALRALSTARDIVLVFGNGDERTIVTACRTTLREHLPSWAQKKSKLTFILKSYDCICYALRGVTSPDEYGFARCPHWFWCDGQMDFGNNGYDWRLDDKGLAASLLDDEEISSCRHDLQCAAKFALKNLEHFKRNIS